MNTRFLQFESTNLVKQFGLVLEVEPELVLETELDYYLHTLKYLRDTFGCNYSPTEEQIEQYILDNEDITDLQMEEFRICIGMIFNQYVKITKQLKKINTKIILNERKFTEKELKRLAKEDERNRIRAYNKSLIRCECGMEYIRVQRHNHVTMVEHRNRIAGIEYYKQCILNDTDSGTTDDTNSLISDI